jgi:hypothetical protein
MAFPRLLHPCDVHRTCCHASRLSSGNGPAGWPRLCSIGFLNRRQLYGSPKPCPENMLRAAETWLEILGLRVLASEKGESRWTLRNQLAL